MSTIALQILFFVFIGLGILVLLRRIFQRKKDPSQTIDTTLIEGNQPTPTSSNNGLCDRLLEAWALFENKLFGRLDDWIINHTPVNPIDNDPIQPDMPGPMPNPDAPVPAGPDQPPTSMENPLDHPDFIEPPGVVISPQYERDQEQPLYPKAPSPFVPQDREYTQESDVKPVMGYNTRPVTGYGPVPPNMPASKFDAREVLAAVDELSRRHSMDDRLSTVSQLVRQILNEPKRKT